MKIVCECGAEHEINCPPQFMEILIWIASHSTKKCIPQTVQAVCSCGVARTIGPGTVPEPKSRAQLFKARLKDAEWFNNHAACGTN